MIFKLSFTIIILTINWLIYIYTKRVYTIQTMYKTIWVVGFSLTLVFYMASFIQHEKVPLLIFVLFLSIGIGLLKFSLRIHNQQTESENARIEKNYPKATSRFRMITEFLDEKLMPVMITVGQMILIWEGIEIFKYLC